MSSFVNSATYEGKSAFEFYKALIDSETSSRSDWKNLSSIKDIVLVPQISLSNITKSGNYCQFGATGSVTLSRKSVTICPYYVNLEICKSDIEPTFMAERTRAGQLNGEVGPAEFTSFLIDYVKEQELYDLEYNTWQASTASCTGGLVGQGYLDSTVIDVISTTYSLSATTGNGYILTEIQAVLAATPAKVRERSDFVIYISREIEFLFQTAIGAITQPYAGATDRVPLIYNGYRLKATPGLSGKQMWATSLGNMWSINDLSSDTQKVMIVDMNVVGDQTARIAMAYKFVASYGIGAEVVFYHA